MNPTENIYSQLGGEKVLREFVDHLYGFMEVLPEVDRIRKMHSADLSSVREHLFMFLSGMLGGPPLYMESFGHPRLRQRHMHFEIGVEERDQWMLCAQRAADELNITESSRDTLITELAAMANHLRNKDEVAHVAHRCMEGDMKDSGNNTEHHCEC